MGLILSIITGLPTWQGVILAASVVTFYTFIGGMWAISVTDFFQSIVIVLGLVTLAVILSQKAGGVVNIISEVPAGTFRFLPKPEFKEIILYLSAWSVLGLGSLPSQDVFQRVMSSGSVTVAVWGFFFLVELFLSLIFFLFFFIFCLKNFFYAFFL